MERIKIGISSCLLGEKVRYDGTHQRDRYITETLSKYFEWVPVCPEVEYGLTVPREAMRLVGDPEAPRLVTSKSGVDHTEGMRLWANKKLRELARADLSGFIFKARSPSSGLGGVKVYSPSGIPSKRGFGIFGRVFTERFPLVPTEDDGRLHDPSLRENFIERVFVFRRWQDLQSSGRRLKDLIDFHTSHKLLILAHSPKHYRELGRLIAEARLYDKESLHTGYIKILTEAMKLISTTKKNTNVLHHAAGYFKKLLVPNERQELKELIEEYRRGLVPLVVPLTLIKHYTRKFDEPYLKRQLYLNPHPAELMLRNHV